MESTIGIKSLNECTELPYEDNNSILVYLCIFCAEQFYSNNFLIKHLSNEHFVEAENKRFNNSIQYLEDESQSCEFEQFKGISSDTLCSSEILPSNDMEDQLDTKGFESDGRVLDLRNSHESKKSAENKKHDNNFSSNKSITKVYECIHCEKQYRSKNSLKNHRKIHESIEKIKCRYVSCSKSFTSSSGYFHHMRTHTEVIPFQCEFCEKGFYQKCNLDVHIRRSHTLDKPYKCQYCEKAFASSTDRQIHQRLHTGEKPFLCDLCNKKFITSSKMSYHRKMHFEVKKYSCKKCDEKYSTRSLLYKHSLDHEKEKTFECDVCGKRCRRKQTLMIHQKLHSEV